MVMTMVQIFKPASFLKLTDRSCLTGLEALILTQISNLEFCWIRPSQARLATAAAESPSWLQFRWRCRRSYPWLGPRLSKCSRRLRWEEKWIFIDQDNGCWCVNWQSARSIAWGPFPVSAVSEPATPYARQLRQMHKRSRMSDSHNGSLGLRAWRRDLPWL